MRTPNVFFRCHFVATTLIALTIAVPQILGQATSAGTTEDGWLQERDGQTGIIVATKELVLHPRGEPRPALRYRLLADEFDRLSGNAAVHYLKAMGFLEQESAREKLAQFRAKAKDKAEQEAMPSEQAPPYVWLKMAPRELPVDEVKEYLSLTKFQQPILREAARHERFDMERNFREVDNPILYLLPEIQYLREVARTQSLRFRLALAENRIEDAIEVIGQQFALARHLSQDEFLISSLVGIAVASITWNDMTYLLQHPDAPNMYWALTAMPSPLVDLRHSMSVERQFLLQQLKSLREVDESPRPAGYWQDFLGRFAKELYGLETDLGLPSVEREPEAVRAALVGMVAAAYPGAREYLIREEKLPIEKVDAYPTAQVVFLAMAWFHEKWRDEVFKWMHLPIWQMRSRSGGGDPDSPMRAEGNKYGWISEPTMLFLPGVRAARSAETRCVQGIALLQAVEGIRMYAAAHDRQLPSSLDALPVPAPIEPFTGKPIDYEVFGDRAVLSGHSLPGIRYRLIVRIAK